MQTSDSRKYEGMVKRRRKCPECGHLEWTIEVFGSSPTDVEGYLRDRRERDKAIGAMGVLVYDGVISSGRMRELLNMDIYKQREELKRVLGD